MADTATIAADRSGLPCRYSGCGRIITVPLDAQRNRGPFLASCYQRVLHEQMVHGYTHAITEDPRPRNPFTSQGRGRRATR